jgi:cytochrome c oxidase subunit 3
MASFRDPGQRRHAHPPRVVGRLSRCHDEPVTTAPVASSTFDTSRVHSLTRPNMVSVGTIVWLASELMFFAGLFAMYFTSRARATGAWPPAPTELAVPYALVFTLILVASSVTCQYGVFAAEIGNVYGLRRWFTITFVMGLAFVLGQANEYRNLIVNHDTTIASSTYGSVFYLTTGFHALHVIGGLVAFVFVLIRSTMGRFTPAQATSAIVVSYYWHFVDVVWVGLFITIYLIQ